MLCEADYAKNYASIMYQCLHDTHYTGPSHGKKEWGGPSENQLGVKGGGGKPTSGVRGSAPETFEKHAFLITVSTILGHCRLSKQANSQHSLLFVIAQSASFSY